MRTVVLDQGSLPLLRQHKGSSSLAEVNVGFMVVYTHAVLKLQLLFTCSCEWTPRNQCLAICLVNLVPWKLSQLFRSICPQLWCHSKDQLTFFIRDQPSELHKSFLYFTDVVESCLSGSTNVPYFIFGILHAQAIRSGWVHPTINLENPESVVVSSAPQAPFFWSISLKCMHILKLYLWSFSL